MSSWDKISKKGFFPKRYRYAFLVGKKVDKETARLDIFDTYKVRLRTFKSVNT